MAAAVIRPEEIPSRIRSDPKRRAEVKLYDAFRLQMGSGWSVFYSVAWLAPTPGGPPRDGETDFIVAHPSKGVLLIEVKGGRIRFDERRRQWISRDGQGVEYDIDPFDQVKRSKYALRDKLRALSSLKDRQIELAHAVAFPDVERPRHAVTPDAPPQIIIGAEDLDRLPARIEEILAYTEPGTTRRIADGDLLVRELTRLVGQSTVLRNPLSIEAADEDREIVRLTEEQFALLDYLSRTRRAAIGGCAGAGKTFLAVEKAKRLAGEEFRTLLTCFNRPLADHLSAATRGTPSLDVLNFHALSASRIREAGMPLPPLEDYPSALFDAVQRLPDRRFDAIVVDEGQDFDETWWVALEACLVNPKQSVLYIFYDSNQRLYRGRGCLPADLVEIPLNENIRNTRAIYDFVGHHYRGEEKIRPRGPVGRTIERVSYGTAGELKAALGKVLHRLMLVEGFTAEDLVVLTPKALERSALPALQLPGALRLVTDEASVRHQHVLVSTIHRFKGLERRVAIVAELDEHLPPDPEERARLFYVAFSRPRTHLVVLGNPAVLADLNRAGVLKQDDGTSAQ